LFFLLCDVVIYYVYRYSIDHNNWLLAEYALFFGIFLWSFTPEFATAFNFTSTQLNHALSVIMYLIGTCFVHWILVLDCWIPIGRKIEHISTIIGEPLTLRYIPTIFKAIGKKLYYDWIVNYWFVYYFVRGCHLTYKWIEKGFIEPFGPEGASVTTLYYVKNTDKLLGSHLYNYICIFLLGTMHIIALYIYIWS